MLSLTLLVGAAVSQEMNHRLYLQYCRMLPLLLLVVGAAVSQEVTKPLTKEEIKALSAKGDIPVR